MPILSPEFMGSDACEQEASEAERSQKPVICVMHNREGCTMSPHRERFPDYDGRTYPANAGDFFGATFWHHLVTLVEACVPYIEKVERMCGVIICAPSDKQFALLVKENLQNRAALKVGVCSLRQEWKPEYNQATVILPVLSQALYSSRECFELIKKAYQQQEPLLGFLPIKNFGSIEPPNQPPFLQSILIRSNRVPANEQFQQNESHLQHLSSALEQLACVSPSADALTKLRIPKYKTLIAHGSKVRILPATSGESFCFESSTHMQQLVNEMLLCPKQMDSPTGASGEGSHLQRTPSEFARERDLALAQGGCMKCILLCANHDTPSAIAVKQMLEQNQIEVLLPDTAEPENWCDVCATLSNRQDVCITLLSRVPAPFKVV